MRLHSADYVGDCHPKIILLRLNVRKEDDRNFHTFGVTKVELVQTCKISSSFAELNSKWGVVQTKLKTLLFALLFPLFLTGCAAFVDPASLDTAEIASRHDVYVASLRARTAEGAFGLGRAEEISYSVSQVSIPNKRNRGTITSEKNQTNPARDFINLGDRRFEGDLAFSRAVVADAKQKSVDPEVLIFVHGFNSGFDKSLFRLAQMGHDFDIPSTQILYAWPSADQLSQYIHDLDSLALARNGLEELIRNLTNSGVKRIVLTGHSMGASMIMETLRQMYHKSGRQALRKIDGVVFFSPDMDTDVFIQSAEEIAPLPNNFVIYTSANDWVFERFAKYLTFNQDRLGGTQDFDRMSALNMTVVDVAQTETDDKSTHLSLAASPVLIKAVNGMSRPDLARFGSSAGRGAISGAVIATFDRLKTVILPPLH